MTLVLGSVVLGRTATCYGHRGPETTWTAGATCSILPDGNWTEWGSLIGSPIERS